MNILPLRYDTFLEISKYGKELKNKTKSLNMTQNPGIYLSS